MRDRISLSPSEQPQPARLTAPRGERVVRGGKVVFYPAPGGTVRIVGVSARGKWIAEFSCCTEDFTEAYLTRMEQHVERKAGLRLSVVP